ncbi:MAG: TauD/TfdA dioxygenase family protein [Lautropia sp.]
MKIRPIDRTLGAVVSEIDLAQPLDPAHEAAIVDAVGHRGVLEFVDQSLSARQLRDFAARFGELEVNVANTAQEPDLPEVMTLSNIVVDGRPVGLADAGQDWHTDMSYSRQVAFANILYALEVPHRDGRPLGSTEFSDMHAAYEALPADLKQRLEGMTIEHDFDLFWERMRARPGSRRAPLTPAQRAARPPVSHPVFPTHPITGKRVLYANPGYSTRINELPESESRRVLDFLFEHQLRPEFRYAHAWRVHSVLMWDNVATIHKAIADYGPGERRLIKRCQVAATRFPALR